MVQDYVPPPASAFVSTSTTTAAPDEDVALMLAAREDPVHFARIYERYFPRIYGYCLRNVNNPYEAEDLASQVFVQSFRNLANYRGGSVGAWLFRIAYGTVVNHYRHARPEIALDEYLPEPPGEVIEPLDRIVQTETHQKLRDLVNTLPPEDRQLLALKLEGELSSQEIGDLLGKNAGAVRTQLHRILRRLRHLYHESEG